MRQLIYICLLFLVSAIPLFAQDAEPTITIFDVQEPVVIRERLADHSARIGVRWSVDNRPESADLVFEQILPRFEIVNVELPRETSWVNSNGAGVVAPRDPGADSNRIFLLMRVVDRASGRMLDFQLRTLPIIAESEAISRETTAQPIAATTIPPLTSIMQSDPLPTLAPDPVQILDFHIYNEFPSFQDDVLLVWDTRNADTVWINGQAYNAFDFPRDAAVGGSYTGGVRLPVSQLVSGPGLHTIPMTVQSSATGSSASASFTIQVHEGELPSQPQAQIISFTVSPQSVSLSGSITLTWETHNADVLSVGSWFVENPNGIIKSVSLNPSPTGSVTIPVSDLVNEAGSYWIGLDAESLQPGWAGSGYSQSIHIMP